MAMGTAAELKPDVAEYLARVDQLYADVQTWLLEAEPGDRFQRSATHLDEQGTGPYQADALSVSRVRSAAIELVPRGRYMLGASGRVDVRSRLGSEMLVWVAAGGPAIGFRLGTGSPVEEVRGRPMYPGVAEGWAWADQDRGTLLHLDRDVFRGRVLEALS